MCWLYPFYEIQNENHEIAVGSHLKGLKLGWVTASFFVYMEFAGWSLILLVAWYKSGLEQEPLLVIINKENACRSSEVAEKGSPSI